MSAEHDSSSAQSITAGSSAWGSSAENQDLSQTNNKKTTEAPKSEEADDAAFASLI